MRDEDNLRFSHYTEGGQLHSLSPGSPDRYTLKQIKKYLHNSHIKHVYVFREEDGECEGQWLVVWPDTPVKIKLYPTEEVAQVAALISS